VSTPLLIYLCVTACALLLCLWAGTSAIFTDVERHGGMRRGITVSAAFGSLLVTGTAAVAIAVGSPRLILAATALPVLTLCAAWSNLFTMQDRNLAGKFFTLPLLVYNLLLTGVYATWCLQELAGLDLGAWGAALVAGDAFVQAHVGHATALESPTWFHLPLVLPINTGLLAGAATGLGFGLGSFLVMLFVMVMPHATAHSRSYYHAVPRDLAPVPCHLGVKVPWGDRRLDGPMRERIRHRLQHLGVAFVTCDVGGPTFDDPILLEQVTAELAWARETGLEVTAVVQPSPRFRTFPAASLTELREDMAHTQWLAAEKLSPDLLVLFAGPMGRLDLVVTAAPRLEDWLAAISRSAGEARQANQDVRLAVSIDRNDSVGEELFRFLKADDSPVDAVGLSIFPGDRSLMAMETDLERLERWCVRTPGDRPVRVVECGCIPQVNGGERGQWNLINRVLRFAADSPTIDHVSIDSLYDPHRNLGLINWIGRRRATYLELVKLAQATSSGLATPGK
jgi:hypothetical protein